MTFIYLFFWLYKLYFLVAASKFAVSGEHVNMIKKITIVAPNI